MKKYIIKAFIAILAISFTSCESNVDVWDSTALDYSGRYMVQTLSEDMNTLYHDFSANEFRIYNTAANVANNIWIEETDAHELNLKSKFTLTGDASAFSSTKTDFADLENNVERVYTPDAAPTTITDEIIVDRSNLRVSIIEGKILAKQATTRGNNVADSIYVKFKLLAGKIKFTSQEVPVTERTDPNVAEFRWVYDSATADPANDIVRVISGHSYTGFAEDNY